MSPDDEKRIRDRLHNYERAGLLNTGKTTDIQLLLGEIDRLREILTKQYMVRRARGIKGGKGRAAKLSPRRRKQIAQQAARTRWARAILQKASEAE